MKKLFPVLPTLIAALSMETTALAQSIDGAVQVGVSTHFLSYTSESLETELNGPINLNEDTKTTRWGLSSLGGFQLEGGYGLTDSLVLGGLLSLGGANVSAENVGGGTTDTSRLNVFLAPKVDYLFLPGSVFRPSLGAAVGLVVDNTGYANNLDQSLAGLGVLGRAGGKWFLTPGFSLDPNLFFGWQTLWGSREVNNTNTSVDASLAAISVGLSLGVSGWIK